MLFNFLKKFTHFTDYYSNSLNLVTKIKWGSVNILSNQETYHQPFMLRKKGEKSSNFLKIIMYSRRNTIRTEKTKIPILTKPILSVGS